MDFDLDETLIRKIVRQSWIPIQINALWDSFKSVFPSFSSR